MKLLSRLKTILAIPFYALSLAAYFIFVFSGAAAQFFDPYGKFLQLDFKHDE